MPEIRTDERYILLKGPDLEAQIKNKKVKIEPKNFVVILSTYPFEKVYIVQHLLKTKKNGEIFVDRTMKMSQPKYNDNNDNNKGYQLGKMIFFTLK